MLPPAASASTGHGKRLVASQLSLPNPYTHMYGNTRTWAPIRLVALRYVMDSADRRITEIIQHVTEAWSTVLGDADGT